jgi:hypothetical protein
MEMAAESCGLGIESCLSPWPDCDLQRNACDLRTLVSRLWGEEGSDVFFICGFFNQIQSHFTTGGWPPISSSWRQAPWDPRPVFFSIEHPRSYSLYNILSDERMGLSFTISAVPRQRSHSRARVPRDSTIIFYPLRFETPPTLRARFPYLYPPGTGWPGYNPRHWVPFSSSSTTRRARVEIFESASARVSAEIFSQRVRVTLRLAVYRQSVCLGSETLESHGQIFFLNWTSAVIVLI